MTSLEYKGNTNFKGKGMCLAIFPVLYSDLVSQQCSFKHYQTLAVLLLKGFTVLH